jgi:hypothetical protein
MKSGELEIGMTDRLNGTAPRLPANWLHEKLKQPIQVDAGVRGLSRTRTMKRAAGRPRDLVDLDDLDAAQPGDD